MSWGVVLHVDQKDSAARPVLGASEVRSHLDRAVHLYHLCGYKDSTRCRVGSVLLAAVLPGVGLPRGQPVCGASCVGGVSSAKIKVKDLAWRGELRTYNKQADRISTKLPVALQNLSSNFDYYWVTTQDDDLIKVRGAYARRALLPSRAGALEPDRSQYFKSFHSHLD